MSSVNRRIAQHARINPSSIEVEEVPQLAQDDLIAEVAEELEEFSAELDARPGVAFAQLIVQSAGEQKLQVTLQAGHPSVPFTSALIDPPSLPLGDLAAEGGELVDDLLDLMWEWSRVSREIREWVDVARHAVGDEFLHLVVWDETGLEIPWELLTVGDFTPGGAQSLLGVSVAVSRRLSVDQAAKPTGPDAAATNALVVSSVAEDMTADLQWLEEYSHVHVPAEGLLDQLVGLPSNPPIGLLYVACHGQYNGSLTSMRLGTIRFSDISRSRIASLANGGGVVFLNACQAGRMVREPRIGRSLFGFAEAFLRQGAAVVVAPTGQVGSTIASMLASEVFREIAQTPEQSVAMSLRNARASVVAALDNSPSGRRALIYAFMFVSYGDPTAPVRSLKKRLL